MARHPYGPLRVQRQPHNLEAEAALLGAVLVEPDIIPDVGACVLESHFYSERHAALYRAIMAVHATGQVPNEVTIAAMLEKHGTTNLVGGTESDGGGAASYIIELASSLPSAWGWESFAHIVSDAAQRRQVYQLCKDVALSVDNPSLTPEALWGKLVAGAVAHGGGATSTGAKPLTEYVEEAQARAASGGVVGLPTGFPGLDTLMSGLCPGRLIIVGARPGQGKSSLLAQFGDAAQRASDGGGVLMFSLEMDGAEVAARMVCMRAGVDSHAYLRGALAPNDKARAAAAAAEISPLFFVDDTPTLTISELRLRALRHAAKHPLSLILVDYLGLADADATGPDGTTNQHRQRYLEVGQVSRGLKKLAKELKVPIVAAHQLNRASDLKPNDPPTLAGLRESGNIEQDADQAILIWSPKERPDGGGMAYDKATGRRWVSLILAKNRHGPKGDVECYFHGSCTKFEEITANIQGPAVTPASNKPLVFKSVYEPSRYEEE